MTQISAAEMRPLVSLSETDDGHDTILSGFVTSAEAMFASYLRRDLDTEFPDGWPADLVQALRLQVSDWYEQFFGDADGSQSEMHQGVKARLAPHRNLGG